jgi:hypothetical protein
MTLGIRRLGPAGVDVSDLAAGALTFGCVRAVGTKPIGPLVRGETVAERGR